MRARVTQKQIAEAAGVHSTTVSLVFRNHPSIPEETRKRIREIAEKMGYAPDPMLSSLAAYRSSRRPAAFQGTLAWLFNSDLDFDWRASPHFSTYHRAAVDRAQMHGYRLESFDLNEHRKNPRQLAAIFRARNIQGLLLCPQPRAHTTIEFPWDAFSVVTFGYTLESPRFNRVAFAFFATMMRTVEKVRARGYQRIGLVLNPLDDARFKNNVLAAYLTSEYQRSRTIPVPPLFDDYRERPELIEEWFSREKPDCIVCQDWRVLAVMRQLGIRPPSSVGLACAGFPAGVEGLSGVAEDSRRIGEVAADLLAAMVQRGERGVPSKAQDIVVEGDWIDGETLG